MRKLFAWIMALLLTAAMVFGAQAEKEAYLAEGGFMISGAPKDDLKLDWMRVDLLLDEQTENESLWADVWVPWPPSTIKDLMLFDGYRLIHGAWTVNEDGHITTVWRMEDIHRLDGTVGIYLMAVFD